MLLCVQMLVVAGGYISDFLNINSVELLQTASSDWVQAATRLPYYVGGARITLLGGRLLMSGGYNDRIRDYEYYRSEC